MKNTNSQSQNRLKWQITNDSLKFSLKVRVKNSKSSSILLLRQIFLRIPRSHFFPGHLLLPLPSYIQELVLIKARQLVAQLTWKQNIACMKKLETFLRNWTLEAEVTINTAYATWRFVHAELGMQELFWSFEPF
jgi:hypothetical protein